MTGSRDAEFEQFVRARRGALLRTAILLAAGDSQKRYGWDYGLPSYAIAAFVGYSRVHVDEHHWADVGVGALIGVIAGQLLTDRYEEMPAMQVFATRRRRARASLELLKTRSAGLLPRFLQQYSTGLRAPEFLLCAT